MIGGGGGGAAVSNQQIPRVGGGRAGQIVSTTYNVTDGQSIAITIGAGGVVVWLQTVQGEPMVLLVDKLNLEHLQPTVVLVEIKV